MSMLLKAMPLNKLQVLRGRVVHTIISQEEVSFNRFQFFYDFAAVGLTVSFFECRQGCNFYIEKSRCSCISGLSFFLCVGRMFLSEKYSCKNDD